MTTSNCRGRAIYRPFVKINNTGSISPTDDCVSHWYLVVSATLISVISTGQILSYVASLLGDYKLEKGNNIRTLHLFELAALSYCSRANSLVT